MFTCLFWNMNRKPLHRTVASLAYEHDVDVVILAESQVSTAEMLTSLNSKRTEYHYAGGDCLMIDIYSRFPSMFIQPLDETPRLTIRRITLPGRKELLLAALHHIDKLHSKADSQSDEMIRVAEKIRRIEGEAGHSRTLLVGDFNMNPFEHGIVTASGLHAVMTRQLAERGHRTVQFEEYPYFYNPMWGHFGDVNPGPPGTCYYSESEHMAFFWQMFDQVLLRPSLLPYFNAKDLQILTGVGKESFLTSRGLPRRGKFSDHLPILFRLQV